MTLDMHKDIFIQTQCDTEKALEAKPPREILYKQNADRQERFDPDVSQTMREPFCFF